MNEYTKSNLTFRKGIMLLIIVLQTYTHKVHYFYWDLVSNEHIPQDLYILLNEMHALGILR